MTPPTFSTITGADWKRSLAAARIRRAGAPQRIAEGIRLAKPSAGQTTNLPRKPMNLLNDIARCDGLLPKTTKMPNGAKGVLWSLDCPKRETCKRFIAYDYELSLADPNRQINVTSHHHGPKDECPDYLKK
jgi:hypothetical protein